MSLSIQNTAKESIIQQGRSECFALSQLKKNNKSILDLSFINKYFIELKMFKTEIYKLYSVSIINFELYYNILDGALEISDTPLKNLKKRIHLLDHRGEVVYRKVEDLHGIHLIFQVLPSVLKKLGKTTEQIKSIQAFLMYKAEKKSRHTEGHSSLNHCLRKIQFCQFKSSSEKRKPSPLESIESPSPGSLSFSPFLISDVSPQAFETAPTQHSEENERECACITFFFLWTAAHVMQFIAKARRML